MSGVTNIIHFLRKMDPGGIESWLMNVLRNMDKDRFHWTFCTTSESLGTFEREIRSLGADWVTCPVNKGMRSFSKTFRSILIQGQYDVVHSHMLLFSGWALRIAKYAGVPVRIAHVHSTTDGYEDTLKRELWRFLKRKLIQRYCTHFIACSTSAARFSFPGKWPNRSNYYIMPCAFDTSQFKTIVNRTRLCESFGISPEVRIIAHAGHFVEVKNHEFLLHVMKALIGERQDVHMLLMGEGALRPSMETLAHDLGICDYVTFTGVRDDVPILMKNMVDLVLFPSRFEGLGLVVVEAQCAGIPALVSDIIPPDATIIKELVHRESLDKSPRVWAKRAAELLEQPHYDKDMALSQVENSVFSISHSVDFFEKLYSGRI